MSKELELLRKLFIVAERLDLAYCSLLNGNDEVVVSADEYEKLMDDLIEAEDYLDGRRKENL